MTKAAERAIRRHIREKATIDHLIKGVRKPVSPPQDQPAGQSPTTSTGLPVEGQVRKKWTPEKGGLPTFWRDAPAFLLCEPRAGGRARSRK